MKNCNTRAPRTSDQPFSPLPQIQNAKFLGGGTNLVDLMRENIEQPDYLVDLPLCRSRDETSGGMSIGALVTNSHLAARTHTRTVSRPGGSG